MDKFARRSFLKAAAAAGVVAWAAPARSSETPSDKRVKLEPFDYDGVKLLDSRWQRQYQAARDFYLSLSDDDILCGYRQAAGMAAPGKPLGGWCAGNSNTVFGQWLSGMARMYRATNDQEIRDKAVDLMTAWAKTIRPNGDARMRHYPFDKLVCGLVDMKRYAGQDNALEWLEKTCDFAAANFNHENVAATQKAASGRPQEWYTLSENLFRAYQLTGNEKYKTFADVWLYHDYWNKLADTDNPTDAQGVHAYSHVNTWSSCAMAYAVTGDDKYLRIIKNAYNFLQKHQCYATGGYGPSETIASSDGGLGRALETRFDTFETACGSWAAFKLGRYLTSFTGEAQYGDWIERIFYNAIGAALPVTSTGKNFYYSDYRLASAMKVYYWDRWACCSGTYIQAIADYHNIIYYKDKTSLYVNLFIPSEVTWKRDGGATIRLTQATDYPTEGKIKLSLDISQPTAFPLKFRVPGWSNDVSVKVNGAAVAVERKPGTWATIDRTWQSGDLVEIQIPLPLRMEAVDAEHPDRVAVVRGPVVLVLEAAYDDPFKFPANDDELNKWAVPDAGTAPGTLRGQPSPVKIPSAFGLHAPDGVRIHSLLRPFYTVDESYPYRMYFDRKAAPVIYW
jgi:hypothetical protein